MKNEILQEEYEKLFEMLHEARHTQTHELITPVEVNHQLATLTRSRKSGGRHLLAEEMEGSRVVYCDC
ncbi:hypothetical protein ACFX11_006495 [Malus domestica]